MSRALRAFIPLHIHRFMSSLQKDINLNDPEQRIKDLLLQFCNHYNATVPAEKQLELRITGGWVRDKLLGGESNDLDIAINVLSGQTFALELLSWAEESKVDLGEQLSSLHTIKANPEKSKHLETCTTKLFGLDVDFVNLRNEQYTDDSRVPIIECGTAEEDALRRDATLNALFYNINNGQIEDYTQRGLLDLQSGILRTPLAPLSTFLDDPLRILRLVRFACRFNFTIDEETLRAMEDDRMRDALVYKISRERVGVEVEKILLGNNVPYGLRLFNHISLVDCIFSAGDLQQVIQELTPRDLLDEIESCRDLVKVRVDESTQLFAQFLEDVRKHEMLSSAADHVFLDKVERKLFWLSTILRPYGGLEVVANAKKPKPVSYVLTIVRDGLRLGNHDADTIIKLVPHASESRLVDDLQYDAPKVSRSRLGLYVRRLGVHFYISILADMFSDYIEASEVRASREVAPPAIVAGGETVMEKYESLLAHIKDQGLENVRDLKPLINGKVILQELKRKPGPWMKDALDEVMRWQLDHPDKGTDECVEYIREYCRKLT